MSGVERPLNPSYSCASQSQVKVLDLYPTGPLFSFITKILEVVTFCMVNELMI